LHLFYARFLHKFFHSLGRVDCAEPFHSLCSVGQVMALTYKTKKGGRYVHPDAIQGAAGGSRSGSGGEEMLVDKDTGEGVEVMWEKMSKSRHNGVDPQETIERLGVDTLRLLILDDAVPRSERRFSLHSELIQICFRGLAKKKK
jgi:leucyl-tRNA synthetase